MGEMRRIKVYDSDQALNGALRLPANAVTYLIVPGLKGDIDREYEIKLDLSFPSTANNRALHLEPNADNTRVSGKENTTKNNGDVNGFGITYMLLANLLANYDGEVYGKYTFRAARNGRDRILLGDAEIFRGSDSILAHMSGRYSEKNTEITSLKFVMDNGPFYGRIEIYKWIEV